MTLRCDVLFLAALCLAAALAGNPARSADARRRSRRHPERSRARRGTGDAAGSMSATACCATRSCAPALDSAARLVMADSTNLSLGPSATIKLDRTVFDDEHTYRDIAIRLATGRVSLRHRTFGKDRLQDHDAAGDHRRARHDARYPVPARQDHRGAAGGRLTRLHAELPVHPTDAARRHRDHHPDRRQEHDSQDQPLAVEFRRKLRGGGRALHRDPICRCHAHRAVARR